MVGTGLRESARIFILLAISAVLEVGGDAGIRTGLGGKAAGYLIGAVLLVTYGFVVNITKLDFSKLMGIYIAVFFVVSQIISVAVFREKISSPTLMGGVLIVCGGLVISLMKH